MLAYAPALKGPFVFDDRDLLYTRPGYPDTLGPWIGGLRPLLMFSYWLNFVISRDPFGFHTVNLVLHILNGLLVFVIVRMILERGGVTYGHSKSLAAFAAAVFLLHPVQTESVAYVAGRSECLSALLFFTAFAVFLMVRPSLRRRPADLTLVNRRPPLPAQFPL